MFSHNHHKHQHEHQADDLCHHDDASKSSQRVKNMIDHHHHQQHHHQHQHDHKRQQDRHHCRAEIIKREILIKNKQTRTTIFWAIFLYCLVKIAANNLILVPPHSNLQEINSSHLLKSLQQQHEKVPTFIKTVIVSSEESSLNCESPKDGCNNRRQKQQQKLCSSLSTTSTTISEKKKTREAQQQHEAISLIKSTTTTTTKPLFSSSTSLPSVIHSSLLQIYDKLTTSFTARRNQVGRQIRSLFGAGPTILMAEAMTTTTTTTAEQSIEKGIVVLNSTNFNRELLQNRHPFPHIKLIEFYVAHSSFGSKFKATYSSLAKEIYSWRNVIRPSVIDVSTNLPIAHSWHVETVPTLRVYPPPAAQSASKIDKQLVKMMKGINQDNEEQKLSEVQDYLYNEYNAAKPMIQSIEPQIYLDNIPQFKRVLLDYIDSYVRSSITSSSSSSTPLLDGKKSSNYIPETWPNLRPVSEDSMTKLLANHPRQELFLMIEGPSAHQSQQQQTNMAFQVMLELSSTASWKAVRYVKASENRALIEDVILQLKKLIRQPADQITGQVEVLENFLSDKPSQTNKGNIVLIHTDDSQSLVKMEGSSFAFISAMTGQDLLNTALSSSSSSSLLDFGGNSQRYRRDINHDSRSSGRGSRHVDELTTLENLSSDHQVELIAKHIAHTYTETKEDRKFIRAINDIYRDISMDLEQQDLQPTPDETTNKATSESSSQATVTTTTTTNNNFSPSPQQQLISSSAAPNAGTASPLPAYTESPKATRNYVELDDDENLKDSSESIFTKFYNLLFNGGHNSGAESSTSNDLESSTKSSGDYLDKIKAIRYVLFNEIPRTSFSDKSLSEQQEKLNILLNLVSVIKSYFPMADSSSIQFIDGVHTYLLKQQSKLLSVNNNQRPGAAAADEQQRGLVLFDTRAFKQELKRLENEDKRLPEVKEFKHCAKGGYPCALWRLFHTLTAFEYRKLNQIRLIPLQQTLSTGLQLHEPPSQSQSQPQQQQLQQQRQQPAEMISSLSNVAPPALEPMSSAELGSTINSTSASAVMINSSDSSSNVPSPGERLVSPPSTTTSLSLTIVGPSTLSSGTNGNNNNKRITEADLPIPVLLVMRDYITNFFGCTECSKNFQQESADLTLERIRQEPADFSILWLWEVHNRVNKRLSVDPVTNPPDNPKTWFPSYEQCPKCYKKPPSFLKDDTIAKDGMKAIFYESIEWNRPEILQFLANEYTKQPMDCSSSNLFASHLPFEFSYILAGCFCLLVLTLLIRCFTQYLERQRRHKATLLNGNGAHYTLELQRS